MTLDDVQTIGLLLLSVCVVFLLLSWLWLDARLHKIESAQESVEHPVAMSPSDNLPKNISQYEANQRDNNSLHNETPIKHA